MPRNSLVEDYYELVKQDYPDINIEKFNEAIMSAFKHFKKRMSEKDLPDVRIKGFGSFQIFSTPILNGIKKLEKDLKKKEEKYGSIREYDSQLEQLKMLKDYVEKNPELFKKIKKQGSNSE